MKFVTGLFDFIKNQPVRFFALVCVAITSAYVMWMGWRLVETLSSPGWCNRALTADKIAPSGTFDALQACVGLLSIQLKAIAINSHVYAGVIALCLAALMVIVVAGGHISLTGSKAGVGLNIGREGVANAPAVIAAQEVAGAAVDKATEIKGEADKPDDPTIPDYAKP